MGIRFRCPNGHKIHVKEFLAGKRGICPTCGASVPIPLVSDAEFARQSEKKTRRSPASPSSPSANPSQHNLPSPRSVPPDNPPTGSGPRIARPGGSTGSDPPSVELSPRPQPVTRPVENEHRPSDPIAESPQAKWYVRPSTGGQYGPAPADTFRSWLDEGRVGSDAYVWREGWPEWQRAEAVFGDLHAGSAPSGCEPIPNIVTETALRSPAELYRRRESNRMVIAIVGSLIVACAILFAALVYVVRFMN